jgi:hypothetical protein
LDDPQESIPSALAEKPHELPRIHLLGTWVNKPTLHITASS